MIIAVVFLLGLLTHGGFAPMLLLGLRRVPSALVMKPYALASALRFLLFVMFSKDENGADLTLITVWRGRVD